MKKIVSLFLALALCTVLVFSLASCGKKQIQIAVPNDTTNEARALELLESLGLIELDHAAGVLATVRNIKSNPYNIRFVEVEAAQLPAHLASVDYAVINSNYAIPAKITPLVTEGTDVSYPNILAVKESDKDAPLTKALIAALNSRAVERYIAEQYNGAIVCDLENVYEDGLDPTVDYATLTGKTVKVAASPTPHADILKEAKKILATKNITLTVVEFTDYVQPNNVVEEGECYANYFQHIPYLEDFNAEHGTHLVSVLKVHHEPMGVYSKNHTTLDDIKNAK